LHTSRALFADNDSDKLRIVEPCAHDSGMKDACDFLQSACKDSSIVKEGDNVRQFKNFFIGPWTRTDPAAQKKELDADYEKSKRYYETSQIAFGLDDLKMRSG
jgi:hypothetical protein